jgi:hypothetical protein
MTARGSEGMITPHDARRGDDPSAELSAEDGTETMSVVIDAVHHRA